MENKRNITLFNDDRRQNEIESSRKLVNHQRNKGDFYLTVSLFKNIKLNDAYVDIFQDETKFTIQRQEVNPYFSEFGFFMPIRTIGNENSKSSSKTEIYPVAKKYNIDINK